MGAILATLLIHPPQPVLRENKFGLPIPETIHKVISAKEVGDKDVLVIGDVHGCLEELTELINTHCPNKENTLFISCGDLINKGPLNIETLHFVRDLPNFHAVRGNHEEHILKHCLAVKKDPSAVLPSKYQWVRDLTDDDIEYLTNLPYTISLPSLNAVVVHAGLYPWKPLEQQKLDDMTLLRDIVGIDDQPTSSKHVGEGLPWAWCWTGPEHVYFGHDARRGLQLFPLATGLDTGCVYGGSLAAKYLTGSKSLLLVKAKRVHKSPNEPVPMLSDRGATVY